MGKAEIWIFSTSLQLGISQVSAVIFFHILQAMRRRKIALIPLHYLGSVSSKTMTSKKILKKYKLEKWPIGYETAKRLKKRPMLKANSVLRP